MLQENIVEFVPVRRNKEAGLMGNAFGACFVENDEDASVSSTLDELFIQLDPQGTKAIPNEVRTATGSSRSRQ